MLQQPAEFGLTTDMTARRYHYESHECLREHLKTFLNAYNFAKRLKTLKGVTASEFISQK